MKVPLIFVSGLTIKNTSTTISQYKHFFGTVCNATEKNYSFPPISGTNLKVILDNPDISKNVKIDFPLLPFQIEKVDNLKNLNVAIIEEPVIPSQVHEKHAIVMINKRRRKMKKHQLKKLRIRMKFEWAKLRQKRELKKEKAFQLEMSSKIKEGERFNAEQFVENKLKILHAEQLDKKWDNVPDWFRREWTERKQNVKNARLARKERRNALHSVYVKDWGVDFLNTK